MPIIAQAILSAAGVFVALFVTRDTPGFPVYQFVVSLIFLAVAAAIVMYWPKIFRN